ncbi:unnamed protein product [Cylindrotheca closterium]|uniref:Crossover junction endonuclease MUS81 n=1 Tax=Cylindrotheca closterium TaxID=2856 RepID=A0AAD2JHL2_9STRA|nr:unnamed protein product [Cylindrotheca closterium]
MSQVIDLCCSSSDEEDDDTAPQEEVDDQDDDSSDDEVEFVGSSTQVVASKPNNTFVSPDDTPEKNETTQQNSNPSSARRTLFGRNDTRNRNKTAYALDSDSSSDDDELLNYNVLNFRSKKTSAASSSSLKEKAKTSTFKPSPLIAARKENNAVLSPPSNPELKRTRLHSPITVQEPMKPAAAPVAKIVNPYSKQGRKKIPPRNELASLTSKSTASQYYPQMAQSSLYDDLRPRYLLTFWKFAQTLQDASYNLVKLDQYSKRVNALALSRFPFRSFEEYCIRFANTSDTSGIQDALRIGNINNFASLLKQCNNGNGRYFSISEACLVALLEHVESETTRNDTLKLRDMDEIVLVDFLQRKESWLLLSELIPMIDSRLNPVCPGRLTRFHDGDNGAAFYTEKSTRSTEYKQIEKLQTKPRGEDSSYIKLHRHKGRVCYELTKMGYETALWIRNRQFPEGKGHYRTSNLVQVDPRFDGISLAVDNREGGGPKKKLHYMCNKLDTLKIPYFVHPLSIGDYCFFAGDKLLPILIERKSIQDVAHSIYDKRWVNQKKRMYHGQYVFGHQNCRMAYIIEGRKESQQLSGGYVGQLQHNVSSEQFDKEIENLQSEGFDVLHTQSPDHSMVELSRWAAKVLQDYRSNKMKTEFTLEEFQREVKKIPKGVNFSKIARDWAESKPSLEEKVTDTVDLTVASNKESKQLKLAFEKPTKAHNEYTGWKVSELQQECVKFGLSKTGKKADLIDRLNGPRPPSVLLERKAKGCYVPSRYNTCATALLVALYLEQEKNGPDWKGMTKDELYALTEALDISKDPFSGVQTGQYKYDGWSSMSDLRGGEFPLVLLQRGHFRLTTGTDISGYPLAKALHKWCLEHGKCTCQTLGYHPSD